MNEKFYEVIVTSDLLGNSTRIMSMEQLKSFNICALRCARQAELDGQSHTWGMWTVKPAKDYLDCTHCGAIKKVSTFFNADFCSEECWKAFSEKGVAT